MAYKGEIETDPAYALVFGSAAHKGIEDKLLHGADAYKVAHEYIQRELVDLYPATKLNQETIEKKWELVKKCLGNFDTKFYGRIMGEFERAEKDARLAEALAESGTAPRTLQNSVEVKLEVPFRKGILTGVIDLILPSGMFLDWKTGLRIPSAETLIRDPQSGIYYYLAKQLGMTAPSVFEYAYLVGKNVKMKRSEKTGKPVADKEDPEYLYSFKVHQDDTKVQRLFAEYVNPLAEQLERGVLYKNPSEMNCSGCQYKTACWNTELPSAKEAREALVLDIIGLVSTETEEE